MHESVVAKKKYFFLIFKTAILRKDIKTVKLISSLAKEGNQLEKLLIYEVKLKFNSETQSQDASQEVRIFFKKNAKRSLQANICLTSQI